MLYGRKEVMLTAEELMKNRAKELIFFPLNNSKKSFKFSAARKHVENLPGLEILA